VIRIDGLQARRERQGRSRRDHKAWLTAIWAVLTLSIIVCGSQAKVLAQQSAGDSWVGKRVITQNGTVLKVGNQVVDDAGHGKQLARGKDHNIFRVYKVEQVNGRWLWLAVVGSGVSSPIGGEGNGPAGFLGSC
jgi:hypothetical protein